MDNLGRYYTQEIFSNLLINQLSIKEPKCIIELGVGGGALVKAAFQRWVNASYFVADVDSGSVNKIKNELPFVNSFLIDTLKEDVSAKLNVQNNSIDIAICNPPYLRLKNDFSYDALFEESNLDECKKLKLLTSDVIFLAKNLQLLRSTGELGIIVPDSLITGNEFKFLRTAILSNHNVKGLIELPDNIFPKTEALTHILILEKNVTGSSNAPLFQADRTGQIVDSIEVSKCSLVERMDFKYHKWRKKNNKTVKNTLASIGGEVKRGRLTHKELKETGDFFVHTTDIKHKHGEFFTRSSKCKNSKYILTKGGDILLARVGCIGKVCKVKRGQAAISDCIYRIRVSDKYREKIWSALISPKGQNWLKANAHGVCAKVISKRDLMNFPLD